MPGLNRMLKKKKKWKSNKPSRNLKTFLAPAKHRNFYQPFEFQYEAPTLVI